MQNIRRELAEKRFTAELNVEASWKFLNDIGCDATQINMDSEDGKVISVLLIVLLAYNMLRMAGQFLSIIIAVATEI